MDCIVENRLVDIEALKQALHAEFSSWERGSFDKDTIDEFVQEIVERPAAEELGLDHVEHSVYEVIDNVDEFRDCVNEFTDNILRGAAL